MTSADRRLQRPDVEIDTPLPRSESNEHVSASCHCHPLSITVGWPQTPSSPIRNQSRGRFESNLPCAPHPANGAQSAHIWLPIWLCLGHSVGKARFSGPSPDGPLPFVQGSSASNSFHCSRASSCPIGVTFWLFGFAKGW